MKSESPVSVPESDAEREILAWLDVAIQHSGGQQREGQHTMSLQVARSLETKTHLLVQAGTGTGKSLAYLVPALYHASHSDKPVVVATATLALQSQIIHRDAPAVVEALDDQLSEDFTVALLKGRANYLCRYKMDGGFPEDHGEDALFESPSTSPSIGGGATSALGQDVLRLREWAKTTETGDRDDLDRGVSDQAWRQVSVSAKECIGASRCPFAEECFSELARERAGESDIIVTNHAMLAIAAFEGLQVLPEYDSVIIDEAHELADRVTNAVTAQLSGSMIRQTARVSRREASIPLDDLSSAADAFDAAFTLAPNGWLAQGPNEAQRLAVESVHTAARDGLSQVKSQSSGADTSDGGASAEDKTGRHLVRQRLQDILEATERILQTGTRDSFQQVSWANRPGHFEPGVGWIQPDETIPPTVYTAPLSVAGKLRENLLSEATCILTSATLAIGDSFAPVAGALGFEGPEAPQWIGTDVGSPFDYPKQGILYVSRHLPKPGRFASSQTYDELQRLIRASQGGALCLFSSRRAAEDAAEELRRRLGDEITILCQGESTLSSLVRQFAEEEETCLFGTMSLWQGVDVPGQACRLVTIDRLPFPRPDDPLSTARTQFITKNGGNGFMQVSATFAAIHLAQGAGRLIRSKTDRGVVAVLDSRLATARYGNYVRSALPDFWYTEDGKTVCGALGRLAK